MPDESKVLIKGADVFRKPHPGVTFLGTEWAMNPVVRGDIQVSNFLDSVGGYRYKERRDKLLDVREQAESMVKMLMYNSDPGRGPRLAYARDI